jgi:hypothetical protein
MHHTTTNSSVARALFIRKIRAKPNPSVPVLGGGENRRIGIRTDWAETEANARKKSA